MIQTDIMQEKGFPILNHGYPYVFSYYTCLLKYNLLIMFVVA
jgi:hypothetical protein